MKIYFTASDSDRGEFLPNYRAIVDYLKQKTAHVYAEHILNPTAESTSTEDRAKRIDILKQMEHSIMCADCVVAETSAPSISVGYEISIALKAGKPVLVLFSKGEAPTFLAFKDDDKLMLERYTFRSLNDVLDSFLNFVHEKSDLRFTFFITPRIGQYLESVAKEDKLPKSVYLRKLIEEDMRKRKKT
jgi:2'-deoxynucleoside 5'-phosphate N-hydrolase